MTPNQVLAVLGANVTVTSPYGELVVDVPPVDWVGAVLAARDGLALDLFDLLTAVDLREAGFQVVLRLWSVDGRYGLQLRTVLPRERPEVGSLHAVFAGARWHERQAAELFGLVFTDHPGPAALVLPDGFVGHPLRKDFVLTRRVETAWPGAKEPGESDADLAGARPRRKSVPLGVDPGGAR